MLIIRYFLLPILLQQSKDSSNIVPWYKLEQQWHWTSLPEEGIEALNKDIRNMGGVSENFTSDHELKDVFIHLHSQTDPILGNSVCVALKDNRRNTMLELSRTVNYRLEDVAINWEMAYQTISLMCTYMVVMCQMCRNTTAENYPII